MLQEKNELTVKDVAEILDTEPYVLRFYEKELNLNIRRNNKGHRVYTQQDIETFKKVQSMRVRGLQLKAIEGIMHASAESRKTCEQISSLRVVDKSEMEVAQNSPVDISDISDDKVKQFSVMMKDVFVQALGEYNNQIRYELKEDIKKEVDQVVEQKISEIKDLENNKTEEYYKKLDETMREVQKIKRELSEDKVEDKKTKQSLWGRIFKDRKQEVSL